MAPMAARLLRKTLGGGTVFELDDPYSETSLRESAARGESHLRLTQGQAHVLDEARSLLAAPPVFWGLTKACWAAFALLALFFGIGDIASTWLAFHFTAATEANPLGQAVLHAGWGALVFIKALGLTLAYALARLVIATRIRTLRWLLLASLFTITLIYVAITISNLMAVFVGADLYHFWAR